jgi:hypothetical protein
VAFFIAAAETGACNRLDILAEFFTAASAETYRQYDKQPPMATLRPRCAHMIHNATQQKR